MSTKLTRTSFCFLSFGFHDNEILLIAILFTKKFRLTRHEYHKMWSNYVDSETFIRKPVSRQ